MWNPGGCERSTGVPVPQDEGARPSLGGRPAAALASGTAPSRSTAATTRSLSTTCAPTLSYVTRSVLRAAYGGLDGGAAGGGGPVPPPREAPGGVLGPLL